MHMQIWPCARFSWPVGFSSCCHILRQKQRNMTQGAAPHRTLIANSHRPSPTWRNSAATVTPSRCELAIRLYTVTVWALLSSRMHMRVGTYHINWRLFWGFSPTNWRHPYQPATSPVYKILYFVGRSYNRVSRMRSGIPASYIHTYILKML